MTEEKRWGGQSPARRGAHGVRALPSKTDALQGARFFFRHGPGMAQFRLVGWGKRIVEYMSSLKSVEEKAAICPECSGTDIVKSIGIAKMTEAGSIGLGHNTDYFVKATDPLVVDLCRNCGTVVRLYVKKADKRWVTS